MKPIRVCHVGAHRCPRTLKLAHVQQKRGEIIPYRIGFQQGASQTVAPFEKIIEPSTLPIKTEPGQPRIEAKILKLDEAVKEMDSIVDLYQAHNEPDWIVERLKERTKKPVIWDLHDLNSLREGVQKKDEARAFELADAIIGVNPFLLDLAKLKLSRDIPTTWYRTWAPLDWFPEPVEEPTGPDFIMATALRPEPGHYRYFYETFETIVNMGYSLTCFSGYTTLPEPYASCKANIVPPTDAISLIKRFSEAKMGLCGGLVFSPYMSLADPNKLYEYYAAGIPVVCLGRHHRLRETIDEHNTGVCVDFLNELPMAVEKIQKDDLRRNVREVRHLFTMDSQHDKIRDFYKEVLDGQP